jgi:hypothetical protein
MADSQSGINALMMPFARNRSLTMISAPLELGPSQSLEVQQEKILGLSRF